MYIKYNTESGKKSVILWESIINVLFVNIKQKFQRAWENLYMPTVLTVVQKWTEVLTMREILFRAKAINRESEDIDNAPTIDAEPVRHGRWMMHRADDYNCSNCGFENDHTPLFCERCGAKMDLKDGESE